MTLTELLNCFHIVHVLIELFCFLSSVIAFKTDIDDCNPNPCHNNVPCTDLIGNYSCSCDGTGYRGQNCDIGKIIQTI